MPPLENGLNPSRKPVTESHSGCVSKTTLPETVIELDVNSSYNKGEEIVGHFKALSGGMVFDGVMDVEFQNEKHQVPFTNGRGTFSFQAKEGGILSLDFPTDLKHGSQNINKRIYVQDEGVVGMLFDLALFFAGWIFVFLLLRKYLKKWFS